MVRPRAAEWSRYHSEWRALEALKEGPWAMGGSRARQEREVGPVLRANPGQGQARA